MADDDRKKVRVACTVLNGLMIHKWKKGFDDGTGDGEAPMVRDGAGIRLNGPSALHAGTGNSGGVGLKPAFTEVDAEWFAAWLEQNKLNPFVAEGFVYEEKDDEVPNAP